MELKVTSQGGQTNLDVYSADSMQSIQENREVDKELAKSLKDLNKERKDFDEKDLKKAVTKLNKFLEDDNTHAEYSTHDRFQNTIMIKIIDNSTKEVIMEVPPKKILDMVAKMCELVGVVFDKKA